MSALRAVRPMPEPADEKPREYLTKDQACRRLQISGTKFEELVRDGYVTVYRLPGALSRHRRFDRDQVDGLFRPTSEG